MKFNPDRKSLKFKLWVYFGMFAAILMLVLWFLQIFFLNTYYKEMKITETQKIADDIIATYGDDDMWSEILNITRSNDLEIFIETEDVTRSTFSPFPSNYTDKDGQNEDGDDTENGDADEEEEDDDESGFYPIPNNVNTIYTPYINQIKSDLFTSNEFSATIEIKDPKTDLDTLAYGAYLDNTNRNMAILYIFTPLYPMDSTVSILANQLVYVTILSLLVAFIMAFYLSRKITLPISNITKTAEELAEGKYGIIFDGGHYSEIIKLADTLTYTSLELARADNMQKDLIANVSHDLRTPLTMVKSYAEMVRDLSGEDAVKRNEHLNVIINEADRLNILVNDLLELSKMQSGAETMNATTFSLKDTIETLLESYQVLIEKDDYRIIFSSYGEGRILADEKRIEQVITNLINNALKYCGKDKTVEINLKEGEDTVKVEVTDHGVGIPKRDLKHVWERYYKASTNRKRSNSTGLGLSIVKEILVMHDAKFGAESEVRHGSTFWFEMKKWRPSDEE